MGAAGVQRVVEDPLTLGPIHVIGVLLVNPLRQTLDPGQQGGEKVLGGHFPEVVVVVAFFAAEAFDPLHRERGPGLSQLEERRRRIFSVPVIVLACNKETIHFPFSE